MQIVTLIHEKIIFNGVKWAKWGYFKWKWNTLKVLSHSLWMRKNQLRLYQAFQIWYNPTKQLKGPQNRGRKKSAILGFKYSDIPTTWACAHPKSLTIFKTAPPFLAARGSSRKDFLEEGNFCTGHLKIF